jgi:hypothetical protein
MRLKRFSLPMACSIRARVCRATSEKISACFGVRTIRDYRNNVTFAAGSTIFRRVVSLLSERPTRRDVGTYIKGGFEVDFERESPSRTIKRLILLPPFAPAAETWALTTVLSNICTK